MVTLNVWDLVLAVYSYFHTACACSEQIEKKVSQGFFG